MSRASARASTLFKLERAMSSRLLDRQIRLLHYLTSGGAIFNREPDAPLDPPLRGLDQTLLHLEARFSHQKRMEKIAGVLPRTFALLGSRRAAIGRDFADACPPTDISRLTNARQFHAFLVPWWRRRRGRPAYVPDVSACEVACAAVRAQSDQAGTGANAPAKGQIRRHPAAMLLRCKYDIRPLFETEQDAATPIKRDTSLALTAGQDGEPRILQLAPVVSALLAVLDDWTDADVFLRTPEAAGVLEILRDSGLVETSAADLRFLHRPPQA
jgi:hypothetical protein